MEPRRYEVGSSTIDIRFGDITSSTAEVLVSSDDCWLLMGGGVSAAIKRAAGPGLRAEADKVLAGRPAPKPGDVVVTSAGDLPAKYLLHAITIGRQLVPGDVVVRRACQGVMDLLRMLGCRSVAFPSIGTGVAGIERGVSAEQMATVLVSALLASEESFGVELYLSDRDGRAGDHSFFTSFEREVQRTLALRVLEQGAGRRLVPPGEAEASAATAEGREGRRRYDIYAMLLALDRRRDELDESVRTALEENVPADHLESATQQLAALAKLREIYTSELAVPHDAGQVVSRSVFLSSTKADLLEHRQRARDLIERFGLCFVGMEDFPPTGQAPADFIRYEVNRGELYVGIVGMRYGSVDAVSGFSMTELEYQQAVASGKPRCMFVLDDQRARVPLSTVEKDPVRFEKLIRFRERVLTENVACLFEDAEELARELEMVLRGRFA